MSIKRQFTFLFSILIWIFNFNFARAANHELTFQDRVEYQRAIEKVYWQHRIWPKENPGSKPSLEKILPDSAIITKVEDYLRKSNALEQYWKRSITALQLQAEMDRMVKNTKEPRMLKEIFAALNNDPHVIAECLARPAIVDRLIHNWYANDDRFHGELRQRAQNELRGITAQSLRGLSGKYSEMEIVKETDVKLLTDPSQIAMNAGEWKEWTEKLQAMFGKEIQTNKLSPIVEDVDRFSVTSVLQKGNDKIRIGTVEWPKTTFDAWWNNERKRIPTEVREEFVTYRMNSFDTTACVDDTWTPTRAPLPEARSKHTAVWTGTEMIVWGGLGYQLYLSTGARYDPVIDNWNPTSIANVPQARSEHTAVWTGTEMIIWGGSGSTYYLTTGGKYNPVSDSWTPLSTTNVPAGRSKHTATWTGSEMIIWGGFGSFGYTAPAKYNPTSDTWELINHPDCRYSHTAIWTGSEIIIWGGWGVSGYLSSGWRYNPLGSSSATIEVNAPSGRIAHSAVLTGTEMIIWGGLGSNGVLSDGGRYSLSTNSWIPTSTANQPSPRQNHTAIWTGNEMLIWGGQENAIDSSLASGGRYDPTTDSWGEISMDNVPRSRVFHSAVWTGAEMIVWGGEDHGQYVFTGGRYDPLSDTWVATNSVEVPDPSQFLRAVWTGSEMIVWGGLSVSRGSKYDPTTDNWIAVNSNNAPDGRQEHSAIWTGIEMIIWGGENYSDGFKILSSGGRYNPSTDTWVATNDNGDARELHTAVWTGTEMIVWGGVSPGWWYPSYGGRYDPTTDSWNWTTFSNAPEGRWGHTAIWSGTEMIIWGGINNAVVTSSGGRYDPATDTWTTTTEVNVPEARFYHTAVWSGTEMIVWGGLDEEYYFDVFFTGGRYDPSADTWIPTSTLNVPEARCWHSAVWTGTEMIIWGGSGQVSTGGRYNPTIDTWKPTSNIDAPTGRQSHTAVWTGSQMIIWGGPYLQTGGLYCVAGHAPVAQRDGYEVLRNNELNIPAPGVLGNDSDEDGDPLTAVLDTNPTHGTLSFNPDGSFIYHPDGDWPYDDVGYDGFTYHVNDGSLDSNIAQVDITVSNWPPVANDDSYTTFRNEILNVAVPGVLANDFDGNGDVLSVMGAIEGPFNGVLWLNSDGSFSYQPDEGFVGEDWFKYVVTDGTMGNTAYDDAIVTITILTDIPIAADDNYQTNKNIALNIAAPGVLGNDSDPNSDPLTAIVDVNPSNGTLTLNTDGSFTYTPNTDYVGADNFTYHANDGVNDSNIATVNLTVNETCLYCDDFNDDNLDPNWSYIKQSWSESNGTLIGTPSGRTAIAIASPIYAGCQTCNIETKMRSAGGAFNKVWMLGWYVDKKNFMELLMKEESDRWVLKQRVNGSVVAKAKGIKTINPNTDYAVRITFDGSSFKVFVDDFVTPLFTLTPQANVPVGTVGFKVKNTIGSFDYVTVN